MSSKFFILVAIFVFTLSFHALVVRAQDPDVEGAIEAEVEAESHDPDENVVISDSPADILHNSIDPKTAKQQKEMARKHQDDPTAKSITRNNKQATLTMNADEKCSVVSKCKRCTAEEMKNDEQVCKETGYHQIVTCVSNTKTRDVKQSCTPDIIYTQTTTLWAYFFQVFLFIMVIIVGILFIRRKHFLYTQQQQRFAKLTSSNTTSNPSNVTV